MLASVSWSIVLQLVVLLFGPASFVQASIHQRRLLERLFKEHNPVERPVRNENETLLVTVSLSLQQIIDVDEKQQTMFFSGWLDLCWHDYNMIWEPRDYGNITILRVSSDRIWTPDLLLYNSADEFDTTAKVNALIEWDGHVCYVPPGMFKSTCPILVESFPFDDQTCTLKFGSWTYDESEVNITNKGDRGQNDSYIPSNEWLLLDFISYAKSIKYDCCNQNYTFVMFEIRIRRRTLYYLVNLIAPCVLISFMSLLGFGLPADCGEKMGLVVTVLLSIIFFSQTLNNMIPPSSLSMPRISFYFTSVTLISSMSILANILVLILHHQNARIQKPMPRWIELCICQYLAKWLGMKNMNISRRRVDTESSTPSRSKRPESSSSSNLVRQVKHQAPPKQRYHQYQSPLLPLPPDSPRYRRRYSSLIGDRAAAAPTAVRNPLNAQMGSALSLFSVSEVDSARIDAGMTGHTGVGDAAFSSRISHQDSFQYMQRRYQTSDDKRPSRTPTTTTTRGEGGGGGGGRSGGRGGGGSGLCDRAEIRTYMRLIVRELRFLTAKTDRDEEAKYRELNWKFAALVIDRLCIILFSIAHLVSTGVIIFSAPNIFQTSNPDPRY